MKEPRCANYELLGPARVLADEVVDASATGCSGVAGEQQRGPCLEGAGQDLDVWAAEPRPGRLGVQTPVARPVRAGF